MTGLREILLAIIVLGCVGLIVELLLLEHVDSWTQWIPLVVLVAGIGGAKLLWFRPTRWSVRLFRWLMAGFVVTGVVGIWLHLAGNRAFELEMEESLSRWLLAWHSLRGATPALAPGAMIQLGLLGLALAWRHPALAHEPTQHGETMRTSLKGLTLVALAVAVTACAEQEATTDSVAVDTTDAVTDTSPTAADGFVNPNEATRADLVDAGLDSAQADALIAGRPYRGMTDVDRALGLDDAQRERVYTRVWLPIDLNTASAEEILLIPGVGPRMQHEFEEYRPYRGIEQFRREIGKYVDEEEVARLERYVTIR